MFRPMRRFKQALSEELCKELLLQNEWGTLSVIGDEGYPYGVPLNYSYMPEQSIIIAHCAKVGHKIDAIRANEKCSFSVVCKDEVIRERFLTHFRSVIVFGKARVITEAHEMRPLIEHFAARFSDDEQARTQEIEREFSALAMIVIQIEHMSGKEALELTQESMRQST